MLPSGPETYADQRPLLQEIFKRERIAGYVTAINQEVQRWLDKLGQSGELDLTAEMLQLTQLRGGHLIE